MKLVVALLATAVSAVPHAHRMHQHLHERRGGSPVDVVNVPGPTVVIYELNGQAIPEDQVQEGIKNGTLVWAAGGQLSSVASPQAPQTYAPTSSSAAAAYTAPSETAAPSPSSYNKKGGNGGGDWGHGGGSHGGDDYDSDASDGVDEEFPDGEVDCSEFPSKYGAVAVSYMGLGGWIGVQKPGSLLGGFGNIETVTSGGICSEGSFCSYACPAGYQKSQWPEMQGDTGQSVGGLLCKNGKLQLTNPTMSKNLCMTGSQQVSIQIRNEMSSNVAVCRTDYPGTEAETVPLNAKAGSSSNLTCPDADNYYKWKGGKTSAQYYVNPKGVSVSDGCQWGSNANPWGNYAPLNLGVGFSNGAAWLSIFQNKPTTNEKLDFAVTLEGDSMSGSCKYSGGSYCSGTGCNDGDGCTVSAASGVVTFVFSDS